MYLHPLTAKHLGTLEEWSIGKGGWIELLEPTKKELACGDVGIGAMKEWRSIVERIEEYFDIGSDAS